MTVTFTAFVPMLNAGSQLDAYDFGNGIQITKNSRMGEAPILFAPLVERFSSQADICRTELRQLQITRGWLWVQRDEAPIDDPLAAYIHTERLAIELQTLLSCLFLAGCGENDYWRSGTGFLLSAAYRGWSKQGEYHVLPPVRFPFHHPTANFEHTLRWETSRYEIAKDLFIHFRNSGLLSQFVNCEFGRVPRLDMAYRIWKLLNTLMDENTRLQLTVTALEAFFIAPSEHAYIWTVQDRVNAVLTAEGKAPLQPEFWENLRKLRNDIAHRAGIGSQLNARDRRLTSKTAEEILGSV